MKRTVSNNVLNYLRGVAQDDSVSDLPVFRSAYFS